MPRSSSHNNGLAGREAQALLAEAATIDLYRRNGFRVLELPVDATSREVNRRKQTIEMAAAHSVPLPPGAGHCLPLEPVPDEYAVREAVQRLGDPERRLVDEFFWFWPQEPAASETDRALQHLRDGDHEAARRIWKQQEANNNHDAVSTHNLAVLYHFLALQWEEHALGNDVSAEERKNIEQLWTRTFGHWQELLKKDGFWRRLTTRVAEFADPRLTAETVNRFRSVLPAALLSINARLALDAVEQGRKDSAMRLVQAIRNSGFPESVIDEGLRRAVEPVRARIKALCRAAKQSTETDPLRADAACSQLFDSTVPLLQALDCLLPKDHPTRDVAHDDVAEQALECQIAFAKKTHNWRKSETLLARAAPLASSKSVRKKLNENIKAVKANADANNDFCGEGYFDLPAPLLAELEEARKLAEAQDHDQAISRLERLAGKKTGIVLAPEHLPLLNKALAYCLGYRSVRRLGDAATRNDQLIPTIQRIVDRARNNQIDDLSFACARIGTIPPGIPCLCMAHGGIISGSYMVFKFRDVPMLICGDCANKLNAEEEARKSRLRTAVQQSATDLMRAGQLDPQNEFVKEQLEQVRQICTNVGVPFPAVETIDAQTGKPKSKCFVATAAYGSPLAAEVETLRWFRDAVLRRRAAGRAFISVYEMIGPPLAHWLQDRETCRAMVRAVLSFIIAALESAGLTRPDETSRPSD